MKLGILTAAFEDSELTDIASWASQSGFSALEIACWPSSGGESRRYAGASHVNVDGFTAEDGRHLIDDLGQKGIEISALGYYPNPLHADASHRAHVVEHLKKIISAAGAMKLEIVNTFVGGDRNLTVDENWDRAVEILSPVVAHAQDRGVTLCFENCPMLFSRDEWPGGHNIAYSPTIWRRIFDQWGDAVGMNYDPSHLVWQMIDQGRFLREFGPSIKHVHAKDLTIDRDGLYENGILSAGIGWQIPRLCGLGDVDWNELFKELRNAAYDGPIIIEHEDRRYEGTDEKIKLGFERARDALRPFIK